MLIDVHGHIGRVVQDRREFMDAANLIARMDAWGIDKCCLLPLSEHPEGAYLECDTEDILNACSRHPSRLIPFCLIDPRYANNPKANFRHLFQEYKERGCKGLGELLPKMDFDDPRCLNLYRQAAEFGFPVLFDLHDGKWGYGLCDDYGLPKLEHALRECPKTVFIGHGPTFWAEISAGVPADKRAGYVPGPVKPGGAVPLLMRQYPTLWADISAGSGYNALTRDPAFGIAFLEEFQDKLLFGTDSCRRSDVNLLFDNVALLRDVRENKKISAEAGEKIAWKNATRLLNL
jgi:predicted TIM-barrel fold metal-dependent hydrolase